MRTHTLGCKDGVENSVGSSQVRQKDTHTHDKEEDGKRIPLHEKTQEDEEEVSSLCLSLHKEISSLDLIPQELLLFTALSGKEDILRR